FAPATFHVVDRLSGPGRIDRVVAIDELVGFHERWLDYVTGRSAEPPNTGPVGIFTPDEYAHMADVRRVFIGFEIAAIAGAVAALTLFARAARRGGTVAPVL